MGRTPKSQRRRQQADSLEPRKTRRQLLDELEALDQQESRDGRDCAAAFAW